MVKRSLYREVILNKLSDQEDKFFENFSKDYLVYLGNPRPTQTQIKEMKAILYETEVKRVVTLDKRLTTQEKRCLFLASKGKTIKDTAEILKLRYNTALEYRDSAIKKLKASNLTAAVTLGIKYLDIKGTI